MKIALGWLLSGALLLMGLGSVLVGVVQLFAWYHLNHPFEPAAYAGISNSFFIACDVGGLRYSGFLIIGAASELIGFVFILAATWVFGRARSD